MDDTIDIANNNNAFSNLEEKYLTFCIEDYTFGIQIVNVLEIMSMQPLTKSLDLPTYGKGVITYRKNVIPIIDFRLYIGMDEKVYDQHTCILVFVVNEITIGLIVDAINSVYTINIDTINTPPCLSNAKISPFLIGDTRYDQQIVKLINTSKIISEDVLLSFSKNKQLHR